MFKSESGGLTGAARSRPPAGRNPTRPHRSHPRAATHAASGQPIRPQTQTSAAAGSAAPSARSGLSST
eukprot:9386292-Alexandrium_andersonii.AAC.1